MDTTASFKTPPRILIPKLVRSRDAWKAKANERKTQRKTLEIRVRDLVVSRDHHRRCAVQLQQQVARLEAELVSRRAASQSPPAASQKKLTGPVADTTTLTSFTLP